LKITALSNHKPGIFNNYIIMYMAIPEINVAPSEQEYQTIYTDVFAFDSLFSKVLLKEDETLR
jgi:dimeric dUTPase (all-alpha-NTP-PPase superfamily)